MAMERQRAARSDAEIDRDVRETLRWDMRINDMSLDVAVVDGRVRLMGWVDALSEKLDAGEDAARIKGVREVINDINVQPQVLRRDEDIARDVMEALRRDRRVNADDIQVTVQNGIVRLTGVVPTVAQKRAASEDAWYTAGIVDLENALGVVPPRPRADVDIASDVRTMLALTAHGVTPTNIDVSVQNGTVYLRGAVDNEMERHWAEEAVRLVNGVTDVVDELVVNPAAR